MEPQELSMQAQHTTNKKQHIVRFSISEFISVFHLPRVSMGLASHIMLSSS